MDPEFPGVAGNGPEMAAGQEVQKEKDQADGSEGAGGMKQENCFTAL